MHDWLPRTHQLLQQLDPAHAELLKSGTLAKPRSQMSTEASEADRNEAASLEAWLAAHQKERKANRAWISSLDNSLRSGVGKSLADFKPRKRLLPLSSSEMRYMAYFQQDGEMPRNMSCIMSTDGYRRWALHVKLEGG